MDYWTQLSYQGLSLHGMALFCSYPSLARNEGGPAVQEEMYQKPCAASDSPSGASRGLWHWCKLPATQLRNAPWGLTQIESRAIV